MRDTGPIRRRGWLALSGSALLLATVVGTFVWYDLGAPGSLGNLGTISILSLVSCGALLPRVHGRDGADAVFVGPEAMYPLFKEYGNQARVQDGWLEMTSRADDSGLVLRLPVAPGAEAEAEKVVRYFSLLDE